MIQPVALHLENFLSFGKERLSLNGAAGPKLVTGHNLDSVGADSNGSGKSALISEAIAWCLFGQTLRGATSPQVVRTGSEGGCAIKFEFQIDHDRYIVERGQDHHRLKNGLQCRVKRGSGTEVKPLAKGKREMQAWLEQVLGLDFNLFCQTVILGQDSLLFSMATDAEKKRILNDVVGLARFDGFLERAKRARTESQRTVDRLTAELRGAEESVFQVKHDIADYKEARVSWEKRRAKDVQETQEKLDYLLAVRGERDEVVDLLERYDQMERQRDQIKGKLTACNANLSKAKTKLDDIEDECPLCGRAFNASSQEQARAHMQDEIAECAEQVAETENNLRPVEGKMGVAKGQIVSLLEKMFPEYGTRVWPVYQDLRKRIQGVDAEIATLEERLRNLAAEEDPYTERLADAAAWRAKKEAEVQRLTKGRYQAQTAAEYDDFWVTGFGPKGIRSYVLDYVANYLNERATYYATFLLDGDIKIRFETQRELASGGWAEDFQVRAVNRSGADAYRSNSMGERQRIDMCVSLALRDLVLSRTGQVFNLFVCDEASANLDAEGSERMVRLLGHLADEGLQVFYVTHDPRMQDLFPVRLEVVKEGGVSRVMSAEV